ncbi:hypothetical protein [Flexivirga caeni]|uniref:Uncharacterized protein n=1 Tax=Flexivirga caeni TaxID=2294115 RepID=A0A3M9M583_9MICO|nr:hypothetical protein [Flexivirga caeni]RNI20724.1 hypothetical protein EFY87_14190 [Flexivirga caeni]
MVTLAIGVFVAGILSGAIWFLAALTAALWHGYQDERQRNRLRQRARRADDHLAVALRDAKRQMNQAAGQSWRNPFE